MTKIRTELKDVNLQLVQTIADQQQNEDRLNLQLTRLRLMYEFVSALNAAQTIKEIYQIALNCICPALRTSRAALMTSDANYSLKYQESVGISEDFKQAIEAFFDDPLHRVELKSRVFPHCAIFPSDRFLQTICQEEKIGAWAVFPLEYENRHLGDIVAYFDAPRQFNDEEVQLIQTIVTYIAIAVTRKQAEQALKESQQFIQRITDTTPNIIYIYDIEENRNIYCNQTIHHILGYTPLEIQAMGDALLNVVIHPDDLLRIKEHYASIRHKKFDDIFLFEYRMKDTHGKWKWFYSQEAVFLCNPDGTVKQTIGAASEITELKEVENRLQASLAEKEVLLREIHHRVKNNLSVVDSLLSMQARYVSDIEALKSLSDSQRRIHTMSLIHEQLYHSQDVGRVDFCEYLQRLVGNLYSSSSFSIDQIELKLDLQPTLLNIDTAISLGLIVNELLTNSFKHAFPNHLKGLIEVILHEDMNAEQRRLHLTIRDNGVGIPKNIDVNSTASLGLRLVKILTQQLRAKLDLDCDTGTRFHFIFESNL